MAAWTRHLERQLRQRWGRPFAPVRDSRGLQPDKLPAASSRRAQLRVQNVVSAATIDEVFQEFDTDESGTIELPEFRAMLPVLSLYLPCVPPRAAGLRVGAHAEPLPPSRSREEYADKVFRIVAGGSGQRIGVNEFRACMLVLQRLQVRWSRRAGSRLACAVRDCSLVLVVSGTPRTSPLRRRHVRLSRWRGTTSGSASTLSSSGRSSRHSWGGRQGRSVRGLCSGRRRGVSSLAPRRARPHVTVRRTPPPGRRAAAPGLPAAGAAGGGGEGGRGAGCRGGTGRRRGLGAGAAAAPAQRLQSRVYRAARRAGAEGCAGTSAAAAGVWHDAGWQRRGRRRARCEQDRSTEHSAHLLPAARGGAVRCRVTGRGP